MVEDSGTKHIQGKLEDLKANPILLRNVATDHNKSTTRYIYALKTQFGDKIIGLMDTPGVKDTESAEVDMSNALSIVKIISKCDKPIFPVILFSDRDMGSTNSNFREDLENYSKIIKNIKANIQAFSYYLTRTNATESIKSLIESNYKTIDKDKSLDS